jgi:hypothetical protein
VSVENREVGSAGTFLYHAKFWVLRVEEGNILFHFYLERYG